MPSTPYAAVLLWVMFFASFAGWRAFATSVVIAADWVLFNAPYWGFSPGTAVGLRYTDTWALTDLAALVAVLYIAQWRWWGFAIAGLLLSQIWIYALIDAGAAFAPLSILLDALFIAQMAVLFMVGGRHCGNSLLHIWSVLSRVLRTSLWSPCKGG